jgi:DNA repair photolyase
LRKEAKNLKGELISISNSSDPYPSIEEKLLLTRRCLEILSRSDCKVQIITKSSLVVRDSDILRKMRAMVSLTITTIDDEISEKLEPKAPPSSERIEAAKVLIKKEILVSVRIDPIIPFLNEDQEDLIKILARIGVKHVTASTYKVKQDNWERFSLAFPHIAEKLKGLYFKRGERFGRSFYLPKDLRYKILKRIKDLAEAEGMKFGCCREGLNLSSATCDGSRLIYLS